MRQEAITLLKSPTSELPVEATWEAVNHALVRTLFSRYPISAISSHVIVRHEDSKAIDEPGTHGSVVGLGTPALTPPTVRWVDAFRYDCTREA